MGNSVIPMVSIINTSAWILILWKKVKSRCLLHCRQKHHCLVYWKDWHNGRNSCIQSSLWSISWWRLQATFWRASVCFPPSSCAIAILLYDHAETLGQQCGLFNNTSQRPKWGWLGKIIPSTVLFAVQPEPSINIEGKRHLIDKVAGVFIVCFPS